MLKMPALLIVMVVQHGPNFLITGPFEVGLPVLAYSRLPEGAAAFGLILSAFGGGSLLGMLAATVLRPPPAGDSGLVRVRACWRSRGLGLAALGVRQLDDRRHASLAAVIGSRTGLHEHFVHHLGPAPHSASC